LLSNVPIENNQQEHVPLTGEFEKDAFDEWADSYDQEVERGAGFPLEGYAQVLEEIVRLSAPRACMRVLDVGTGTGNLGLKFTNLGCKLWGTDFSDLMLARARVKLPEATLLTWDLRSGWPPDLDLTFNRIVSAYVFHHFSLPDKVNLLGEFSRHLSPGGRIVIGDISFRDAEHKAQVKNHFADTWDEEEYWIASRDLLVINHAGLKAAYLQVSSCAGIYTIRPISGG
jgi:putative AdoMet-dependent methyltransferase